jgi:hypothetical protein
VILIVAGLAMEAGPYLHEKMIKQWMEWAFLSLDKPFFVYFCWEYQLHLGWENVKPVFFFGISPAQALKTRSSRESFGNCMELPDLYEGSTYLKPCIWPAS